MLFLKENPTGIDIPIQRLQERLFAALRSKWGLSEVEYRALGRVYRNQSDKGYIPEAYIGGREYEESFIDDRFPVTSFFHVDDNKSVNRGHVVATVGLIFHVNLTNLKHGVGHRADEEVRADVFALCRNMGYAPEAIITGIENVFREYSALKITFSDMHPYHCFRLNFPIGYSYC